MNRNKEEQTEHIPPRTERRNRRGAGIATTYAVLWTPALFQILATAATWGFAHACFVLLPKYLSVELGVGAREIGRTMGAFGIASVPLSGVAGVLVDRRPYRIAMALAAVTLALSAIGFAMVETFGAEIYGLRALQALANALMVTAVGAAVVEVAPASRHAQAIGLTGAVMLAMNAIAPMVVEPLAASAGWQSVFVLATVVALASTIFLRGLNTDPREPRGAGAGNSPFLFRDTRMAIEYAGVSAASGVAFGTVMAFEQPLALAAGQSDVGSFLAAFAIGALALRVFAGALPDRIGRGRAAVVSLGAYAVGTAMLGVVPVRYLDAMGLWLGLSHGLFFPALNVLMLSRVPRSHRGRALALFTGAFHLGVSATAVLGPIAGSRGYPTVFALAGMIAATGAVALVGSKLIRGSEPAAELPTLPVAVDPAN